MEIPEIEEKEFNVLDYYWEGEEAYEHGVGADRNPYDPGTDKFQYWYRGWYEASQDDK